MRSRTFFRAPAAARAGSALALAAILASSFALLRTGIGWGLPSRERAALFYADPQRAFHDSPQSAALRSYHPDEPHTFMALNNMSPGELDFNPRYFFYPTLYIYTVGGALQLASWLGAVTLVASKEYYFHHPDAAGALYLVGRLTTMFVGLLTLVATYRLGRLLFGRSVGIMAATFLAAMPLFVVQSRYVTTDIPVTLAIVVSLLCTTRALETGRGGWYVASGLAVGLATATKYYGIMAVLPLIVGHLVTRPSDAAASWGARLIPQPLRTALLLVPVGFLAGCPYAILAPAEFLHGLSQIVDAQRSGIEKYDLQFGYFRWHFFYHLYLSLPQGMGVPAFLLALGGVAWALYRRTRGDVLLLSFVLPFYVMLGLSFLNPMRYTAPLLPPLVLFAARLVHDAAIRLRKWMPPPAAYAAAAVPAVVAAGYALLIAGAHTRLMASPDTRDDAAHWLRQTARPGATVGLIAPVTYRIPPLDERRFDIRVVGLDPEAIARAVPEYLVLSEIDYRDFLRARHVFPAQAELVATLLSGRFTTGAYRYRPHGFSKPLRLFGWSFEPALAPHDGLYVSPDIYVLEREGVQ